MAIKLRRIDFNPDLFNNIYWHLKKAFENILVRYIWLYGGSSASKTYSVVQLIVILMLSGEKENTLVLRKFGTDIKDSIFSDFENIIKDWELSDYFIIQQNFIKCVITGSFVRFRGLDDSEKVKGISNFKRVILEEISQFDEEDLKQIRKRLRGREGQQIIGIFNPVSEEHWIKKKIFDIEGLIEQDSNIYCEECDATIPISGIWVNAKGNMVVFKTNYLDNVFIVGRWEVDKNGKLVQVGGFVDQHVIDDFERDKVVDFNYYQIYGLGNWGKLRTGGEFWKDFNPNSHITKIGWFEDLPLHISWDENVNPFITCLVWQIVPANRMPESFPDVKWAIQIDEICLEDPRNRVKDACLEFMKRYPQDRVKGLFVYGDRTSIKEDTKLEKGENFFTKVHEYLKDYKPTLRMQSVNPSIVQSGGFINETYAGRIDDVEILINEKCTKSLNDYQYALEDSDGTLKKSKKTNPVTKVQYEEYGHNSDAKRYFFTVAFANEYQEYLRGGKVVKIRSGKKSYSKSGY